MDLGVDDPGSVIERRVQEPVADRGAFGGRCVAFAVDAPSAADGDAGEFLDIDKGYDADVLAIDGDPLAEPSALHAIRAVFLRGVRVR